MALELPFAILHIKKSFKSRKITLYSGSFLEKLEGLLVYFFVIFRCLTDGRRHKEFTRLKIIHRLCISIKARNCQLCTIYQRIFKNPCHLGSFVDILRIQTG